MVALDRNPQNLNYLSVIGFHLILHRAPNVEWFIQEANIPGLDLPAVDVGNQFVTLPFAGDHMTYASLDMTIIMDENLNGYQELHNWLTGLAFPKDFSQYKELTDADRDVYRREGVFSDMSLTLLTSLKNPNIQFNFRDAWPTSISGWEMTNTIEDVMYATAEVSFRYGYFDVEVLNE